MDWFSWLSKTNLDPSLIYEYGLAFARNELQEEDLAYFNHEFLQSMGISVAKHRLEILKISRKEVAATSNGLSKLFLALEKTRKGIKKCISKLGFYEDSKVKALPELEGNQDQWKLALTRKTKSDNEFKVEKPPIPLPKTRKVAKSGPLDRNVNEKLMITNRTLKLSGPLDCKVHDRLVFAYKSPKLTGNSDGRVQQKVMVSSRSPRPPTRPNDERSGSPHVYSDYGKEGGVNGDLYDQSLWSALFHDMKPT